jgi:N-hydroxyarylamine O-acetyltransferase
MRGTPTALRSTVVGMEPADVSRYLLRIGVAPEGSPTLERLRELHAAHLMRVPFENLSIHLDEPILLGPDDLVDKILTRNRGGFCFELNGAFAMLLSALRYRVTHLAARVWTGERFGPLLDHLVLAVDCPDRWLVDVGFGAHSLYPLRLEPEVDQKDPGGTFRIARGDHGDIDVIRDGGVQYRIEERPRVLADFEAMCWWHQTSPRSHFTAAVTSTLQRPDGRITISGNRLIRTVGSERTETEIPEGELLESYERLFGLRLPRLPMVRFPRQG